MEQVHLIPFGPFCLDMTGDRLWREEHIIALRPRSLAVLRYLVEHPGRLVTKAELLQHVWAGTHVSDTVLRVCVREIRAALGDTAVTPQYLETVSQQGYRFLAGGDDAMAPPLPGDLLVGRQHEVETLAGWFQQAAQGERQLVFVSGEVGVGKTTVLNLLLARLAASGMVRLGWGQCSQHYGEAEPYLPLFGALRQLGRGSEGPQLLAILRRYAPMWLVHLPGLISDAELERVQRQVQGATQARMLRELAEALEVLTSDSPLVLVLEDLHWSDSATVDFLAYVAQRREPARLLILGTYRPVEAVIQAHPVRGMVQELGGKRQCAELRLELLPAEDVAAYVAGRLAGAAAPLAAYVHERTNGNALFMVNIVEHLVRQGLVVRREEQWELREGDEARVASLPEGLRQLILRRIEELPAAARQVLEVASVVGAAFATAAVAAGLQSPQEDIEAVCEGLVTQQRFIDDTGLAVWPDGTSGGAYQFQHALYQQVLYEQIGSRRRAQLHQRIGARLEAAYGAQAGELAVPLAMHCERGGELQRAVHYMQQAGEQAARRNAPHETVAAFSRGLELLATLPESPERTQYEIPLQLALGETLITLKGRTAPQVRQAYSRAYTLCQQASGETPQRFQALWGLIQFYAAQAQLHTASELSQQLFDLVSRQPDPAFMLEGHLAMGAVAFHRGDSVTGRTHLEQSLHFSASPGSAAPTFPRGFVSRLYSLTWLTMALWELGYADQAQQRSQEALALAQQAGHTLSLVFAELYAALLSQCRRDVVATQAHADAAMTLAATQESALRVEQGRILRGWALAMQGDAAAGVAHIHQALAMLPGVGPELLRPYWLSLLTETYRQAGQPETGLQLLDEALALVAATEERWWEAELYRLKGELLLQLPGPEIPQAVACLRQALDVAHGQQARTLELRAALSLSRLWQQQGKHAEAKELLAPVYSWFTEGFDTVDLQEARRLLEQLA